VIVAVGIPAGLRIRTHRGKAIRRIAERLASENSTARGYPDGCDWYLQYYLGGQEWCGQPVSIAGPGLAAAVQAGLVDEYRLLMTPVAVGGGTSVFPNGVRGA
jgi:hypothetical protein